MGLRCSERSPIADTREIRKRSPNHNDSIQLVWMVRQIDG